jgi:hypothetical protein
MTVAAAQPVSFSPALRGLFCAAAAGGLAVLYAADPATDSRFPPCPFHYCTGLYCPGCGSLRAIHSLLHGHLLAAWHFNPLMVLSIPFLGWLVLEHARRAQWLPGWPGISVPSAMKRMVPWVVMAFFVLRNLPCQPFLLLAPH